MSVEASYNLCMGKSSTTPTLLDVAQVWQEGGCTAAVGLYVASDLNKLGPSNVLQYQADNMRQAQIDTNSLIQRMGSETFTDPSQELSLFRDQLVEYCADSRVPGVCDTWLQAYCTNRTREEAATDPFLTRTCGCYVPPDPTILSYANQSVSPPIGCETAIDPGAACDSLCRLSSTIKKSCLASGVQFTCPQNVCVIDQVSIDSSEARVGEVSFNTICGGCENGCVCIVEVESNDPNLNLDINQFCGANSTCLVGPPGQLQEVPCQDIPASLPSQDSRFYGYLLIGLFLLVLFIGLVVYVLSRL